VIDLLRQPIGSRLTTRPIAVAFSVVSFLLAAALRCPESASSDGAHTVAAADAAPALHGSPHDAPVVQAVDTMPRDSVADLPKATVDLHDVAPTGRSIRVAAGANLQSALNRARPGDVLLLAPGATYQGNFVLPGKRCDVAWITVRTDVPDAELPPAGQRITPAYAARLAKIATANSVPAIKTTNPTCGWRLMGLEVTVAPSMRDLNYMMMALGDGGWAEGGENQTRLEKVPADIVLDRVYVHGQPFTNSMRCLALNSARTAIVNSWFADCHAKGFDSQAIVGWNGPGPYLIENNHLAGAGENVMFGGADPGISGLVPADITFRRNHLYKDPAWKGKWTIKNLFELKSAKRVLIENNVFENNWADAQAGMAIVIKSSTGNQAGRLNWQGTTDVTFRYNLVRNSPRGFNLQAEDGPTDVHTKRVRAEQNLFENIGTFNGTGQDGWLMLLTHDLRDVKISHNTFVNNSTKFGIALVMDYAGGAARHLTITDNIFTSPVGYGIFYSEKKVGEESLRAMAGSSWTFSGNVIGGIDPQFAPWHPPRNYYPPTVAGIGFVDPASGDYRIGQRVLWKGRASDGTDPGVNFGKLQKAIEGVVVPAR